MREVVNKLFTFQMRIYDPDYQAMVERWLPSTRNWDEPVLEAGGTKRFNEG